jgi:hypothetical protein
MQTRNKANASHHMSLFHILKVVVVRLRDRLAKSKLPSSVHGEIPAPYCDSGTNSLKLVFVLLVLVLKDAERLLFVYIGRPYTNIISE